MNDNDVITDICRDMITWCEKVLEENDLQIFLEETLGVDIEK